MRVAGGSNGCGGSVGESAKNVEILACDWNGTLVDDVTRAWRVTREVLQERNLPAPELCEFLSTFRLPLSQFFADCGVPRCSLSWAEARWNNGIAVQQALPMPGLKEMLDGLHEQEILVGVISAAGSEVVEADVARLDLEGRFAFVRCSASPKREALGQLAGQSGGRVAYLGDTEHDITEAPAAGAYPIGFAGGYRPGDALEAAGAGHVVGDLSRVPELLVDDLKTSPTHR